MKCNLIHPPILIPAGKCPHSLMGTTDKEIVAWASLLRSTVSPMLTRSALRYWVRQSFYIFSTEHEYVCDRINTLIKEPKCNVTVK